MANKTSVFLDNNAPKADQIWLNMVTSEVANAIPMAGDAVDSTGLVNDQLLKSIKSYVSQAGILCTDTSSGANCSIAKLHPCHRLDKDTSGVIIFSKGKKRQKLMITPASKPSVLVLQVL